MAEFDLLIVLIEISVALAGFAGIIASLQLKSGQAPSPTVYAGLGYIVNSAFLGTYLAALPILLHYLGYVDAVVWKICSAHFSILPLVFVYQFNRTTRGAKRSNRHRIYHYTVQGICIFAAMINVMNLVGFYFNGESGPVLIGLAIGFASAANLFSRLLLAPIARGIRRPEAN